MLIDIWQNRIRAVTRALTGGGGVYIHTFVFCPINLKLTLWNLMHKLWFGLCILGNKNLRTLSLFVWSTNDTRYGSRFKPVFHFSRIVAKCGVFYYVHIISSAWVFTKQWNTQRFATTRLIRYDTVCYDTPV